MRKKTIGWIIFLVLLAILAVSVLGYVINNRGNFKQTALFIATVLENQGTSLLVEPNEGEDELSSSDKIVIRVPLKDGELKDLSEFIVGSKVKINYDGAIMESYPAQINAYDIEYVE